MRWSNPLGYPLTVILRPAFTGTFTFGVEQQSHGSAKKDARIRTSRPHREENQHVPRLLTVLVDFLTVHPSTNRSPQSTPPSSGPQTSPVDVSLDCLFFELLSTLFRYLDKCVSTPSVFYRFGSRLIQLCLQHAKHDHISRFRSLGTSFPSRFLPLCSNPLPFTDVGHRAFDDCDAVERWRSATSTTRSQYVIALALQYCFFLICFRISRYRGFSRPLQLDSRRFVFSIVTL